ncbi:hypothetical protein PILCRDRAFT_88827 [Piloderma croceum F 1598]|uniref:Protein kinase domain-containing protein n=1 Tax=Piloderma croceum (strain F 1598) TaxID=765440 RepID=A0A0C3FBF7_PILCF|nr:hypothetical protein PILCRDRAFT_88827 [Piloderma croceum F 1598]
MTSNKPVSQVKSSYTQLFRRFKETLQEWNAWDIITMVENHQLIKDYLTNLFREHLQAHPSHPETTFNELLNLDVVGLCAHLTVIVTNDNKYTEVLARSGPGAQSLLDLLQALSRASGLYPECLVLKGVHMEAHPVAGGGYGDVFKGLLQGKQIAVKVLRIYQDSDLDKLLKEFSAEAVLWRQLSHPNVLPFYGVYHLEEATRRLCLTAPWMENGNIVDYLKLYPNTDCVRLALDTVQGLQYLHSLKPSIIHGDLKGLNVLVTSSRRACIADFGLATAKDSKTLIMSHNSTTKTKGTMRWQAPELLSPYETQDSSKASDVYGFACVCYEMFSGEVPFYEDPSDIRVVLSVMQGKRPPRPSHQLSGTRGLNDAIWQLVETCWAPDPTERPTAKHIVEQLSGLLNMIVDDRPVDDFNINFPSQMLYNHTGHPFYTLSAAAQNPLAPHHLSLGSAGSLDLTSSSSKDGPPGPNDSSKRHLRLSAGTMRKFEDIMNESDDHSIDLLHLSSLDKGRHENQNESATQRLRLSAGIMRKFEGAMSNAKPHTIKRMQFNFNVDAPEPATWNSAPVMTSTGHSAGGMDFVGYPVGGYEMAADDRDSNDKDIPTTRGPKPSASPADAPIDSQHSSLLFPSLLPPGVVNVDDSGPEISKPSSTMGGIAIGVETALQRQAGASKAPLIEGKAECSNCGTTHTPLWRRGLNDELNCNACGLYYKLHKHPRPKRVRSTHGEDRTQTASRPETVDAMAKCYNCNTVTTPLWRKDDGGNTICNAYKLHGTSRPKSMKSDVIRKRRRNGVSGSNAGSRGTSPGASVYTEGETMDGARSSKRRRMSTEPPSSAMSYSSYNEGHSSQTSLTSRSRQSSVEFSSDQYPSYDILRGSGNTFWRPPMAVTHESPQFIHPPMVPSEDSHVGYFHPPMLPQKEEENLFNRYLHPPMVPLEESSKGHMNNSLQTYTGNGSAQSDYFDAPMNQF